MNKNFDKKFCFEIIKSRQKFYDVPITPRETQPETQEFLQKCYFFRVITNDRKIFAYFKLIYAIREHDKSVGNLNDHCVPVARNV